MTFDFGALPPEINSTRMYTGPGAGPLMAAAAAWNNVAAELNTTASATQSVISTLTDDEWQGPSASAMASAAMPYVEWMQSTAGAAQLAANQAMASAAAYDAAFTMTVPPPAVVANRVQLAGLVATNILGQNTPAIAVTEAQYGEMWAQDAAAMYGYAGSSASAGTLEPLSDPAPTTNPGGLGGQAAAVAQATGTSAGLPGLVSGLPAATQSLSGPLSAAASPAQALGGLDDFFDSNLVSNIPNGIVDMASWNGFNGIVTGILYAHTADAGLIGKGLAPAFGGLGVFAPAAAAASTGAVSPGGAPVLAGMGQASSVGKFSVPVGWSAAAPSAPAAAAPLAGSGWTSPAQEATGATNVAAGMPAYASAGRGGYGVAPRYGVKPTVMPRHLVV
ncbi:PPE family protein [Mycobacterium sp.]|uniref:PPE family protein n=1 Tax=Mycobacterium sp. TaxID=1785 RepID=UPI003D124127